MQTIDKRKTGIGRRGFLRVLALLGVGAATWGLHKIIELPADERSDFVVVNGWVLPAQYFRRAPR